MGDDTAGLTGLVTVHHPDLDRYDRVSLGAANAMAVSGWEIVDDLPAAPPAVAFDVDPEQTVDLYHPGLDRHTTVPAGAARALTKAGGWTIADPDDDQAAVDTDGTPADQTTPTGGPADTDPTTTED